MILLESGSHQTAACQEDTNQARNKQWNLSVNQIELQ
jgi:hypothetical protein